MKFFFVLAFLVAFVACAPLDTQSTSHIEELQWSTGGGCNSNSNTVNGVVVAVSRCTKTAIWKVRVNDVCTVSEYFRETLTNSDPTVTFASTNGIAQCTKTPCGATEKIPTDCATAFGEKLSKI
ncbi:hypothetical protein CAEBREN_17324 [Caenorhabditis brenneri]|uniref:Uncharacterized protein n=1 Tax=Caenorhabditis brenneri TaxID=135651 RepID=G0PJL4_CAEBE|nr:hypothetical protein CAEBREN_17324 [Caenorhabditis brenneri]